MDLTEVEYHAVEPLRLAADNDNLWALETSCALPAKCREWTPIYADCWIVN
jgi:hypothetical protein